MNFKGEAAVGLPLEFLGCGTRTPFDWRWESRTGWLRGARQMNRLLVLGVLATLACADSSIHSVELPVQPGLLQETIPPEGFEGPLQHAIIIGLSGVLTRSGYAFGHLPPEAGDLSRASLLWIGCYVRETSDDSYVTINRVPGSTFPCGVVPHDDHLDAVIESARTPSWMALVVVNVP